MKKREFTNLRDTGKKIQRFMRPLFNACSSTGYSVNSTATLISINNQKYIIFAHHAFSNIPAFDKYLYLYIGKHLFKFSEDSCYNFDDISIFKADNKIIECTYDLNFFNCDQHISLDQNKEYITAWNGYRIKQGRTLYIVNNSVHETYDYINEKPVSSHGRFLIAEMQFFEKKDNFLYFKYPLKDIALNKERHQLAPLPRGLSGGPIIISNVLVEDVKNNNKEEEFDTTTNITLTGNFYLLAIGLELQEDIAKGYDIKSIVDKINSIAPSFEFQESILHI